MKTYKRINFYVSAIYISPPDSMGGNTKILLELINNLSDIYNFIIFTSEPDTFRLNVKDISKIELIDIKFNFKKMNFSTHISEILYVYRYFDNYFRDHELTGDDYFYSSSDFAPDVLPIYNLKRFYDFKWISSLYLFIPNPLENIIKRYKFPILKYVVYYIYQRFLLFLILKKFDLCIITNDIDRKYFPKKRNENILALYGGVNLEQIIEARKDINSPIIYDAVYCSRLHQQKGISQLLDIWSIVVDNMSNAKLAIIGNGDEKYELFLRNKSKKLGLEKNIDWLGYINNTDKYKIYLKSKTFLHTTIYDNNGMVAAEALCSGLPVIMYDLKGLRVYNNGCIKVGEGDIKEYANTIIKLINDREYYRKTKIDNKDLDDLKCYWDWKNRSEIFKKFINDQKYE